MKVYNTLIINYKTRNVEIKFGIPDLEEELLKMFKLRYEIYSQKNYIDPDQFPDGLEKDEYDKNNKTVYFIASINDDITGTLRIIKDYPLPTQLYFKFQEPEQIKNINKENLAEIGRLIVKPFKLTGGVFLPRHLVMLMLFKSVCNYAKENNILGGYAFIKKSLEKKLRRINFPLFYISQYEQRYPKNGVLFKYFNNPDDPVIPVYFLRDPIDKFLNKIFKFKLFVTLDSNYIIFKDTKFNRFLLNLYLKLLTKIFS